MRKTFPKILGVVFVSAMLLAGCTKEPTLYTVTFMSEGIEHSVATVQEGLTVQAPKDPVKAETKEGDYYYTHTFKEWLNGTQTYDFSTPVTSDLILTADFKSDISTVTVTFKNGTDDYDVQTIAKGTKPEKPETDPTQDKGDGYDYTFDGWYDGATEITTFPEAMEDTTYKAHYASEEHTYSATIKYDYEGGAQDEVIEYTISNRDDKLKDIEKLLPEKDEEASYSWKEPLPETLPFKDDTYTVVAKSKFFEVDMASQTVDSRIKVVSRNESAQTLEMVDGKMVFTTENNYLLLPAIYDNFELEFDVAISGGNDGKDRMTLVLGTDETNMALNHGADDATGAVDGVTSFTLVPGHASSGVRVHNNGSTSNEDVVTNSNIGFNKDNGVTVKVQVQGVSVKIYFNNSLSFSKKFLKFDTVNHTDPVDLLNRNASIGLGFSGDQHVVTFSKFKISKMTDFSVNYDISDTANKYDLATTYQNFTSDGENAGEMNFTGRAILYSFFKTGKNFRFDLEYKFPSSDRISVLFGLQDANLDKSYPGGASTNSVGSGVLNTVVVPNHGTASIRLFQNGEAEAQRKENTTTYNAQTGFVKIAIEVYEGTAKYFIGGELAATLSITDENYNGGYVGFCTAAAAGSCYVKSFKVKDNFVPVA